MIVSHGGLNISSFHQGLGFAETLAQSEGGFGSLDASESDARVVHWLDDGRQCIQWANGTIKTTAKLPFYVLGECIVRPFIDNAVCLITDIFKRMFWPQCPLEIDQNDKTTTESVSEIPQQHEEEVQQAESTVSLSEQRLQALQRDDFPFSKISERLSQEALTVPTPNLGSSEASEVVFAILKSRFQKEQHIPGSASWNEMQNLIENIASDVLVKVLKKAYDYCNFRCSYFYILLKMGINKNYALPKSSKLMPKGGYAGIKECLSGIDVSSYSNPTRLIELVLFKPSRLVESIFLPHVDINAFYNFLAHHLTLTPFKDWPNKGKVIARVFETSSKGQKTIFAHLLEYATCDDKTHEVGLSCSKVLEATTLLETSLHLSRLMELLPHMNDVHLKEIFHCSLA